MFSGKKCLIKLIGHTHHSLKTFKDHFINQIADLQEVLTVEECDFILVFCPVVAESDIEVAMEKLSFSGI